MKDDIFDKAMLTNDQFYSISKNIADELCNKLDSLIAGKRLMPGCIVYAMVVLALHGMEAISINTPISFDRVRADFISALSRFNEKDIKGSDIH